MIDMVFNLKCFCLYFYIWRAFATRLVDCVFAGHAQHLQSSCNLNCLDPSLRTQTQAVASLRQK